MRVNVAVTRVLAVRVTLQLPPTGVQFGLHPAKDEPRLGVAVTVTSVPKVNVLPGGVFAVMPEPFPAVATVRVYVLRVNVAVTRVSAVIVNTQLPPTGVQFGLHPAKDEPRLDVAVTVTSVP